ncbi:MAG TPA: 3'-5' exonuclease, partial [Gemmatimonadaceae bacterium]
VAATEPLEGAEATDREKQSDAMRRAVLTRELKAAHLHLPRPLPTVGITACSIMSSKGLGADIVFVIGFDQGRLPSKAVATESEKYQMLVALTRAKKRLYFINTTGKEVSGFVNGIDGAALVITDASE